MFIAIKLRINEKIEQKKFRNTKTMSIQITQV